MSITDMEETNQTKNIKLYSSKAIGGATFLGGPLAAGYMIGENFKALDRPNEGRNSLLVGIMATIVLFGGIFMVPEHIIDKIPRQLIPLVYTGITWGIVEWKQGEILKSHKENGNLFFSGWRAAGIGFISLLIVLVGLFGYIFFGMDDGVYEQYDKEIGFFSQNEAETLVFYDNLNTETNSSLIHELETKTIPKWRENIEIINKTNKLENLPSELMEQNKILLRYAELRLEAFELFKKAFEENTDKYALRLELIHQEINKELQKLN